MQPLDQHDRELLRGTRGTPMFCRLGRQVYTFQIKLSYFVKSFSVPTIYLFIMKNAHPFL